MQHERVRMITEHRDRLQLTLQTAQSAAAKAAAPTISPPPSAPPADGSTGGLSSSPAGVEGQDGESLFSAALGQEFSLHVLKEMCKKNSLAISGSRAELARRLTARTVQHPDFPQDPLRRRPSRPQLTFIAAVCRRQGLVPELGVIATTEAAHVCLTANQDRGPASQN